jgi:hypothetical protein
MNKATPIFSPFCTDKVWLPKNDPSATTSLNHKIIADNVDINPNNISVLPLV